MRSLTASTISVLTSLALLAGAAGFGSLALAATGGPTVVLSSTSASTTSAASIPITATFSEAVNGFATSSITATNASVTGLTGSSTSFSFNVIPTASGTVTVAVNADMATASATPNKGNQASNTLTFTSTLNTATSAPVISNILATATGSTTATISWNTDVNATGQVVYGSTTSYNASSTFDSSLGTLHTGFLGGLLNGSLYHFAVMSGNSAGTTTSTDHTFTAGSTATTTATTTTPLAVTGIDAVNTSAVADGSFASGWKWIIHFVVPVAETSFQLKFGDFTSSGSTGTIPAAGNMRYFSPQSSNASSESSAITETSNAYGAAMTLTGDTSTTTAGRQIDVTIEAAIPTGTPIGSYSTTFGALSQ